MKAKKVAISDIIFVLIILLFIAFLIVPFVYGIIMSFTNWMGFSDRFDFVGLDNYIEIFVDKRSSTALATTVSYLALLLPASIFFGYMTAKVLHGLKKGKATGLLISFFPYILTPVVVSLLWNQLYYSFFVQLGQAFRIDILSSNILANPKIALVGVAIVDLWMLVPYTTLLFFSALDSMPTNTVKAAKLDGAGPATIFFRIKMPYILPTLGVVITIIFSYAFTHIDTIMTLTGGGPARSTETIFYVIYRNSTLDGKYGLASAEGILVAALSIAVYFIISKLTSGKHLNDISSED